MDARMDNAFGRMLVAESFLSGELSLDAALDRLRDIWDVAEPLAYIISRLKARPGRVQRNVLDTRFGCPHGTLTPAHTSRVVVDGEYEPDVSTWDDESLPTVEDVEDPRGLEQGRYRLGVLERTAGWVRATWPAEKVDYKIDRMRQEYREIVARFGKTEIDEEQPLISPYESLISQDLVAWLHRDDITDDERHATAKELGLEEEDLFGTIRAMRRQDWIDRTLAERKAELRAYCTLVLGEGFNGRSEIVTEWAKTRNGKWFPKAKTTLASFVAHRLAAKDSELAGYASLARTFRIRAEQKCGEDQAREAYVNAMADLIRSGHELTPAAAKQFDAA